MPIWLDDILGKDLAINGGAELIPRRKTLEVIGDGGIALTLEDDPTTRRTKLTIDGSGVDGGGGGGGGGSTLATKEPVRAASTANVANLGAASTSMDGVTLVEGDRVLLKNQSTGGQNGIYVVGAVGGGVAPLTRAEDADASSDWTAGTTVYTQEGTTNARKVFYLTTTGAITLGTTALVFAEMNTLAGVLAVNRHSGANSPIIDADQDLRFNDSDEDTAARIGLDGDDLALRSISGGIVCRAHGSSSHRFEVGFEDIVSIDSAGIDFASTMRANFLGDIDVSRNGSPRFSAVATTTRVHHPAGGYVEVVDVTTTALQLGRTDFGGGLFVAGVQANGDACTFMAIGATAPTTGVAGRTIMIQGGPGGTGNQTGGDIMLLFGEGSGSGVDGSIVIGGSTDGKLAFFNGTPASKQTITGSRGGNAALADLLTKLASYGLIVDSTS
jgi:hypothetical protein